MSRVRRLRSWPAILCLLAATGLPAGPAPAADPMTENATAARKVLTDGDGWFETCGYFNWWCRVHLAAVPDVVESGTPLYLRTEVGTRPFFVRSIQQLPDGSCRLYARDSHPQSHGFLGLDNVFKEGIVHTGPCTVLD